MARRLRCPAVLSVQSHVVYGAAGNSAAVFPMRRLGANVYPLNTVQFSNHTQYGKWEGIAFAPDHITDIISGIKARGVLPKIDALLSGYLGSPEQGTCVLGAVRELRAANPAAIYACDPVMGHPAKGCVVHEGVQRFFADEAAHEADLIFPNVLELGVLAGGSPTDVKSVVSACRALLHDRRPRLVLVKHLAHAGLNPDEAFEMLAVTEAEAWHVQTPLLQFDRPPVGTGDLTSGLFLTSMLHGASVRKALEHTASAYHAVMQATLELGEYELQTVAAQDEIAKPSICFEATLMHARSRD